MNIPNKYYLVDRYDQNMQDIIKSCVGLYENQRMSLDGQLLIIKLAANDTKDYKFLKKYKKYNHVQILKYLSDNKQNWETEIN